MEERMITVDLKIISCRDLKAFNLFQKQSSYVVVFIVGHQDPKKHKKEEALQRQQTPIDGEGESNPEWNHEIVFDLTDLSVGGWSNLFLRFDIRCKGVIFGDKTVGEVSVPIEDLIGEFNGAVRFMSYQIRTVDGKPNGVLNFSYRVNGTGGLTKTKTKTKKTAGDYPILELTYPPENADSTVERVCYPVIEVDDNPSNAGNSFIMSNDNQKTYYPTSEVIEEMRMQSSSPLMVPSAYYHQYSSPPAPNGYYYNFS